MEESEERYIKTNRHFFGAFSVANMNFVKYCQSLFVFSFINPKLFDSQKQWLDGRFQYYHIKI